jgi:hypothetical protein
VAPKKLSHDSKWAAAQSMAGRNKGISGGREFYKAIHQNNSDIRTQRIQGCYEN